MNPIEAEAARVAGWVEDHLGRHHTSAAPAAEAVTINTSTPGGTPMSLSADLHAAATRLENLGEDFVNKAEKLKATPEGSDIVNIATKLIDAEAARIIPGGTTSTLLATLKGIEGLAQPYITAYEQRQAAQSQQGAQDTGQPQGAPNGPVVAGQA